MTDWVQAYRDERRLGGGADPNIPTEVIPDSERWNADNGRRIEAEEHRRSEDVRKRREAAEAEQMQAMAMMAATSVAHGLIALLRPDTILGLLFLGVVAVGLWTAWTFGGVAIFALSALFWLYLLFAGTPGTMLLVGGTFLATGTIWTGVDWSAMPFVGPWLDYLHFGLGDVLEARLAATAVLLTIAALPMLIVSPFVVAVSYLPLWVIWPIYRRSMPLAHLLHLTLRAYPLLIPLGAVAWLGLHGAPGLGSGPAPGGWFDGGLARAKAAFDAGGIQAVAFVLIPMGLAAALLVRSYALGFRWRSLARLDASLTARSADRAGERAAALFSGE